MVDKKKAKEQKRKEEVENLKKARQQRDARTEGYQAVAAWEEGWSLHGG